MIDQMSAFLQRLRKSTAGNTLAIAAAALVPLVGMVGGAVDISRYYMAVSRMQNACDAGALAARKQMESDAFEEADRTLGLRFFDQNYPDGTFGLENLARDYTADADGTVTGTATGEMPTTIMQIFGKTGMDIAVSCSAEINISNTDIMFVLDVTGSMAAKADGSWTCSTCTDSRIANIRTEVVNFYDAVEAATSGPAQVRYGIVPYASNVNVGGAIPLDFIADEGEYQSRQPREHLEQWWETLSTDVENPSNLGSESFVGYGSNWDRVSGNVWSQAACDNYAPADTGPDYVDGSLDQSSLNLISESQSGNIRTRVYEGSGTLRRGDGIGWWDGGRRCYRNHAYYDRSADFDITIVDEWREEMVFDGWDHLQRTTVPASAPVQTTLVDLTDIRAGGVGSSITERTGWQYGQVVAENHTWNGCIEEADTVDSASWNPIPDDPTTWSPIPAGAYDLDINLVPSNNAERWKPFLPSLVYRRYNGSSRTTSPVFTTSNMTSWRATNMNNSCPKPAMKLSEIDRDQLVTYLSAATGFVPSGYTYHDIGMIWGARFISPRGIFADENESAPNGDSIARHIVFMTDGELQPGPGPDDWSYTGYIDSVYDAYGIEYWDRRVTEDGTFPAGFTRRGARLQAACRQARQENISVWVIAFGTALTQNLIDCATPGRAYSASDPVKLNAALQDIAQKIAALRLTS